MGGSKTLVVDDSPEICDMVTEVLKALPVQVVCAASVKEANEKLHSEDFSQFIIDLHLPDGDGYSLVNEIRSRESSRMAPITILSASTDIPSKVSAFSLGADDYVVKPFNLLELRARVEAKLKRVASEKEAKENLQIGGLRLDAAKQQVFVTATNQLIRLSPTEFRILAIMAKRQEVIFSRQQILDQVWGDDVYVNDRTVDTHIYTLRKKLGSYGALIRSVPGEGYCFDTH